MVLANVILSRRYIPVYTCTFLISMHVITFLNKDKLFRVLGVSPSFCANDIKLALNCLIAIYNEKTWLKKRKITLLVYTRNDNQSIMPIIYYYLCAPFYWNLRLKNIMVKNTMLHIIWSRQCIPVYAWCLSSLFLIGPGVGNRRLPTFPLCGTIWCVYVNSVSCLCEISTFFF